MVDNIPGPDPINNIVKLAMTYRAYNSDQNQYSMNLFETYGDVVHMQILGKSQVIIGDPDLANEVLVSKAKSFHKGPTYTDTKRGLTRFVGRGILVSDGEFWKKQRKLVAPALHAMRIRAYAGTMVEYTQDTIAKWGDNTRLDIAEELMHLTLRIVARTLFDTDIEQNAGTIAAAMEAVNDVAGSESVVPTWIPTPRELRARRASAAMDEYVYDLIHKRRAHEEDRGDLLSMLLLAEDDDGNRMSDKQVRDEAVTLFLAGHETTANALNWVFMLLAQHPDVEAKLHAELDSALQGRTPTLADLKELPYTEMVIKESMRLYPPVSGVGREVIEDVQIGDYLLPKGTVVGVHIYRIQRHPRYWDDSLTFNPERWRPENAESIKRQAYIPFGNGARICIGNSFAMMEAQLILATIAQRFQLSLEPNQVIIPESRITMYPRGGLPMTVNARQPVYEPQAQPELEMA